MKFLIAGVILGVILAIKDRRNLAEIIEDIIKKK